MSGRDGLSADVRVSREAFELRTRLRVPADEVLGVLGPNGAGKSTLLSVLAGLLAPDEGSVLVDGRTWVDTGGGRNLPTHRRGVGLLAQEPLLFPHLTAEDNVAFGPRVRGARRARARHRARAWLSEVDAGDLARHRPAALSGGQAQRVALARALAAEPGLLLLDEPLAALDVDAAPAMRSLLHRVLRQRAQPSVLVTHDVLDAVVLADRIAVLVDGRVVEQGPTRQVLARPTDEFTARLAGVNLVPGPVRRAGVQFGPTSLRGQLGEPLGAAERAVAVFAPSAVAVHRHRPEGSPRNAVQVRVAALEPRGDVVRVRARAEGRALAADVTPAAVAELGLVPEERVWFAIKATEVAIHPVSGGSCGRD
ncbi:sulfate/molybdate ABC transporter ATP-binding protein [Salinifilum ghardaiensis]